MMQTDHLAHAGYNHALVLASVTLLIFAACTSFSLLERSRTAQPRHRTWWRAGAALMLGAGIWTMHFFGMLAMPMPPMAGYAGRPMVTSLGAGLLGIAGALWLVERRRPKRSSAPLAATLLTGSVALVHFIGMRAMQPPGGLHYAWPYVAAGVVVAWFCYCAQMAAIRPRPKKSLAPVPWVPAAWVTLGTASLHYLTNAGLAIVDARPLASMATGMDPAALWAVSSGMLMVFALATLALAQERRAGQRIAHLNALLTETNAGLDARVAARTAELERSNQALQEEARRRERAERLSVDQSRQYRLMFEQASVGIAHVDADGGWTRANSALCRILGRPEAELRRLRFQDLTHPDDLGADIECLDRLVRGETDRYELEKRYFHRDGHVVWCLLSVGMHRPAAGGHFFIVVIHDISDRKAHERQIAEQHQMLELAMRTGQMAVWSVDGRAQALSGTDSLCGLLGLPAGSLPDLPSFAAIVHPDDRAAFEQNLASAASLRQAFDMDFRVVRAGGIGWLHAHAQPAGPSGQLFGVMMDVTERKRREAMLRQAASDLMASREASRRQSGILQSILDGMADGVVVTDEKGEYVLVNPAARLFIDLESHRQPTQADGLAQGCYLPDQTTPYPASRHPLNRALRGEHVDDVEVFVRNGHFPLGEFLSVSARPMQDDKGRMVGGVAVFHDISERKRSEARLLELARYDQLTGLPNRHHFLECLEQDIARAREGGGVLALLFLDLDRFKEINDTLGHAMGDELLKLAAQRLRSALCERGTIARLGGDEFTVVLAPVKTADAVSAAAESILASFRAPFILDEGEYFISTSIGIALYPQDADTPESLMQKADIAMYHAKNEGRSGWQIYSPAIHERAAGRLDMENRLRRAIERDELELYYQPQVSLATGQIDSAEALLRWHHPELGELAPARFIRLAEETGLIVPIGEWVIDAACRQHRQWFEQGLGRIRVTVNVSARQLRRADLVDYIRGLLDRYGMAPAFLELEITEGTLMENIQFSKGVLDRLEAMGLMISIDDFGTGYSSLNYLRQLPLEVLKLDQSFVRNLPDDERDNAIARTVITLAHGLKLKVVAEGVERPEHLRALGEYGCDYFQGYFCSPPLPADQFAEFLRRGWRPERVREAVGGQEAA